MTHVLHGLRRRAGVAALLVSVTLLVLPGAVLAHAELRDSDPADGAVVEGTPGLITADFTDTLADGSRLRLRDAGGTVLAEGGIDPADDTRMTIDPPELAPGAYEIRWQAIAEDGHLERGRYAFTVEAPASTPEPTDPASAAPGTPSAGPSAAATATPAPVTPVPSVGPDGPGDDAAGSTGDIVLPILAVLALVAVGGAFLLGRRRTAR